MGEQEKGKAAISILLRNTWSRNNAFRLTIAQRIKALIKIKYLAMSQRNFFRSVALPYNILLLVAQECLIRISSWIRPRITQEQEYQRSENTFCWLVYPLPWRYVQYEGESKVLAFANQSSSYPPDVKNRRNFPVMTISASAFAMFALPFHAPFTLETSDVQFHQSVNDF